MQPQQVSPSNEEILQLQRQIRDLDDRYLVGVQNIAVGAQQAKVNKVQSWANTDKLVNDFFAFSLVTLGAMATVLSAKETIIGNKALFYIGLGLQAVVVILSSVVRLYLNIHTATTSNKIFEEFSNRVGKIDVYRVATTNTPEQRADAKAKMESAFADEYDYKPSDTNWLLKNGPKAVVVMFVAGFLAFISSIVFTIGINTK